MRTILRTGAITLALTLGCVAANAGAQRVTAAMLDRLEPGDWEVRDRDGSGERIRLCIDSGRRLVQIRHQNETCRSVVAEDTPGAVTIAYSCPGNGNGRTRIRFENPRLVQLETQGIASGLPFEFTAEARRMGNCPR
ncbi:hypothetical protein [Novosphingobium cyanobacteriorum]|uniref:hypothetical protein n=1 Tax=Novosphingobium cyanobacteriorum TaxID=3024215 RepID=UPI0023F89320|nr:hypothetical protein [Novosphingobium cyanobacteriorum]